MSTTSSSCGDPAVIQRLSRSRRRALCFLQMALSAVIGGEALQLIYRAGLQKQCMSECGLMSKRRGRGPCVKARARVILSRYIVSCSYPAEALKGTSVVPAGCRGSSGLSFPRYIFAGQTRLIVFLARR